MKRLPKLKTTYKQRLSLVYWEQIDALCPLLPVNMQKANTKYLKCENR
jgi:hypothetical protein